MSLTKVSFSMISGAVVNVLDYGADSTGVSDSTSAINAAIATGSSVYFPNGTYLTTGSHTLTTDQQQIFSEGSVTLKRSSGTNVLFDVDQSTQLIVRGFIFDGNSLGGSLVRWRGHYSTLENCGFKNVGGTSYALWVSGCNVSTIQNLNFNDTCYGAVLFDNGTDPVSPDYACLYTIFNQLTIGTTVGGSAIKFAPNSTTINLSFNACLIEGNTGGSVPPIDINGQTCRSLTFNNIQGEYANLGSFPYIFIRSAEAVDISFNGGYLASNYNNSAAVIQTSTYVRGLTIDGVFFTENGATASTGGRTIISLEAARDVLITNNIARFCNDQEFVKSQTAGANTYLTVENNYTNKINLGADGNFAGDMTLTLQGDFISVRDSNMICNISYANHYTIDNVEQVRSSQQAGTITVADDGYYEIHGDGGTSAAPDFKSVITIAQGGATTAGTEKNNFATFYAQVGSGAGLTQTASILVGSNVEIDITENAVAALATTTDGKLGVQLGYASGGANRYVRVYNRTGAAIELAVNLLHIY